MANLVFPLYSSFFAQKEIITVFFINFESYEGFSMQRLFIIILFLFPLYQNIFPQVIPDDLDSDDILWVRQNAANLRFAPNPTWPPAEFIDDSGNYQGIVADYVGIIEKNWE